jgi:hypothetical protein
MRELYWNMKYAYSELSLLTRAREEQDAKKKPKKKSRVGENIGVYKYSELLFRFC